MNFSGRTLYNKTKGIANDGLQNISRRVAATQFKKPTQKLGKIESVFVADDTLYAILRRVPTRTSYANDEEQPLFNNFLYVAEKKLSAFELYVPISNINLAITVVDPKTLIGKYAMVTLLGDNRAIEAHYTGSIKDPSKGPLKFASGFLYNARMLAGGVTDILSSATAAAYLEKMGVLDSTSRELLDLKLEDVMGKSVRVEGDSTYSNTTSKPSDSEIILEDPDHLIENSNQEAMKSKDCHLPVVLFSAR